MSIRNRDLKKLPDSEKVSLLWSAYMNLKEDNKRLRLLVESQGQQQLLTALEEALPALEQCQRHISRLVAAARACTPQRKG